MSKATKSNILSISPPMYREYANEYKELARSASDDLQRALYLKMASMWEHAALRFENGFDPSGQTTDRELVNDDQPHGDSGERHNQARKVTGEHHSGLTPTTSSFSPHLRPPFDRNQ
jgi:hypothetical protein